MDTKTEKQLGELLGIELLSFREFHYPNLNNKIERIFKLARMQDVEREADYIASEKLAKKLLYKLKVIINPEDEEDEKFREVLIADEEL